MDCAKAQDIAWTLMKSNALSINLVERGWTFGFDKSTSRFGCCFHHLKEIKLSRKLVSVNDEVNVKDTILHEIAHAIAGHKAGHSDLWKLICVQLGAKPERCYSVNDVVAVSYKWQAKCKNCGKVYKRHKLAKKSTACGHCCNLFNDGMYDPKYRLDYYAT